MTTVGIIANPASGRDIRRLVAQGSIFDNWEKTNIVTRVLAGLDALGVERVVFMPEYFGIVPLAAEKLKPKLAVEPLEIPVLNSDMDTQKAAALMREAGVGCIVTLGGDGTNRAVAKGCGPIPLIPISTGTNNVFPGMVEGTVAGIAAAVVARGLVDPEVSVKKRPQLELRRTKDGKKDIALIDAAVHEELITGARAIYEFSKLSRIAAAWTSPTGIGLSSLAAYCRPDAVGQPEGGGLLLELGEGGTPILAPVAPGVIEQVYVKDIQVLEPGRETVFADHVCVLAMDGERDAEVWQDDVWMISFSLEGPRVVDIGAAVREAARLGVFGRK